ncbi:phage virion morphogenesis protein [Bradyrhizobium ottawaense]|uniref:Phage virion morphogenesis (Putative tail completion) protein n=1 Tax=Bradyrhizobium ottawaense TaxID=931866 RepID=A0ABY0QH47_9BRAD|nr:phage virion morphogenesis protein [Bradyrhizobium ottawaense]SDK40545.1 phage virion morphogenesis (putative tail completion) protein [Bradyrhizobium ottawaense]
MSGIAIKIDHNDIGRLNKRITELLHDVLHMEPVMAEAAEYMKRSTVNRVLRSKTSPDGERWEALRDVTVNLKGHDRILFEHGDLANSIQVGDVSNDGFMVIANAKHASYMQEGIERTRGMIRNKKVPPRPFMGFSDENKRRISQMIRDYLAHGGD